MYNSKIWRQTIATTKKAMSSELWRCITIIRGVEQGKENLRTERRREDVGEQGYTGKDALTIFFQELGWVKSWNQGPPPALL